MKKSLVLAMAMALGVTASAYAANPFSDVPAGHWAYDSIDKLAAAGVIEGMGDGSYQGDRTMTRYEMAQIVAKAMAKGCNVDKLAAEFADELDALGVRVAALEKKADNVKISGYMRATYWDYHATQRKGTEYRTRIRSNITLNGQVNENWDYVSTLRNEQFLHDENGGIGAQKNKNEEEDIRMMEAYVNGRVGGLKVQAGRISESWEAGWVYTDQAEGIRVSYGKDLKVTAGYGKLEPTLPASDGASGDVTNDHYAYARVDGKLGVVAAHASYYNVDAAKAGELDAKIAAVGINTPIAKNVAMDALYLRTSDQGNDVDRDGYVVGLAYKGAKADKAGSWGMYTRYFNQPQATTISTGHNGNCVKGSDGFIGWQIGAAYIPAKNIVTTLEYWNAKEDGKPKNGTCDTIFAQVQFNF